MYHSFVNDLPICLVLKWQCVVLLINLSLASSYLKLKFNMTFVHFFKKFENRNLRNWFISLKQTKIKATISKIWGFWTIPIALGTKAYTCIKLFWRKDDIKGTANGTFSKIATIFFLLLQNTVHRKKNVLNWKNSILWFYFSKFVNKSITHVILIFFQLNVSQEKKILALIVWFWLKMISIKICTVIVYLNIDVSKCMYNEV